MAEKLGLGPEVRELKIGDSFSSNKIAFHTLRYDFKPASVVSASKHASIEVGTNHQITVTHLETAGAPHTVFKGSQKPYQKECVLIIDKTTGEITLEKLSTNLLLKKTRQEHRPTNFSSSNRPPTPVAKKPSPPQGHKHKNKTLNTSLRHSPLQSSPSYPHRSPTIPHTFHKSPPQVHITSSSPSPAASLPLIEDSNDNSSSSFDLTNALPELKTSPDFPGSFNDEEVSPAGVGILSDSSTDSSSDSGSSDSESEKEKPNKRPVNGHVNGKSSPSLPVMPEHLLNEDLQLSESGSDSD